MDCTTNPTHHQNCIIFCAFAILVAFARLEGKGGGGWGAMGWEENKTSQIYYMVVFATCVGKGAWGGLEKNPTHHQNYITFAVCAILVAFAKFVGTGGRWVGHKSNPPSKLYSVCCICYTEY